MTHFLHTVWLPFLIVYSAVGAFFLGVDTEDWNGLWAKSNPYQRAFLFIACGPLTMLCGLTYLLWWALGRIK